MTEKKKSTAPVSSVGADGEQPKTKNHTEIIANEIAQINLQATNCPEKSGQGGGLQTVSMTELYDTVYPPRTPVVDGFLYVSYHTGEKTSEEHHLHLAALAQGS